MTDPLVYTAVPDRIKAELARRPDKIARARARLAHFPSTEAPTVNADGDTEVLGDVTITHRFVDAPGDSESVRWHLVESGPSIDSAPTLVFLHGLPDSWWQWHYALEHFGRTHHCLAIDLKGYGQSDKRTGDYRQEGVAVQLAALLDVLSVGRFGLVTHDRGTPVGDHLVARSPYRVERYVRGEQHLWHLHPDLYPQEAVFVAPTASATFGDARTFVVMTYGTISERSVSDADLVRTVSEFSQDGVAAAVPRYFASSSFRQEWVDRRTRLISAWTCPVLLMQGRFDAAQPWEFYTDPAVLAMLPTGSAVEILDAGHFWPLELPRESNATIEAFLT